MPSNMEHMRAQCNSQNGRRSSCGLGFLHLL